ncbi:hypothetical protein, partial [Rivihabitans pingtungensis]|uniref:hypothetical protein n=1 Tax=Rivihabitans pingtungensis TaxID=1054498 RepID=UPI002BDF9A3F
TDSATHRTKSRSQNPLALLCDFAVLLVLSAVTRLARTASLGFMSGSNLVQFTPHGNRVRHAVA